MVRGRSALFVKLPVKLVAPARQRIEPGDAFQINVVVRLLRVLERELRGIAPAVRFGPKVSQLYDGTPEKPRHADRNLLASNPVHISVSVIAPGECGLGLKENEGDQHATDQPSSNLSY